MPDMLTAEPFLGGHILNLDDVAVAEVTDIAIVSIATPMGGGEALGTAVQAAWGCALPSPRGTTSSGDGSVTLIFSTPDQTLALLPSVEGLAVTDVAAKLGDTGYYTEQTDNWVGLRVSGAKAITALERICPLDMALMPVGGAERTVMEHLGVFIMREAEDRFLLLSGSSSAKSFLHAVELSMRNVT